MNNAEIDESVLINNTAENFQVLCTILYPHIDPSPHIASAPYIRIDLSDNRAFYSTNSSKQPTISIDLLMQLLILPTYKAKVVFIVENITLPANHPWKNMYEQFLRDSM